MKNIKRKKKEKVSRRDFLKKVVNSTKYLAVGAISSEVVQYMPSVKAQRPDLLPGGEGDYEGV